MTKFLFTAAFVIGALAIIWVARIFLGVDTLGLGVTVLIAAVYAIGAWELVQFRRATHTLSGALSQIDDPIDDLSKWLLELDPSLQNAVRQRIEGERNGLPAPVVTPYLVGLLVMLGLLGTFVGMVDTLKGAVVALEGSNELEAIRAGLAAPIEGLGLAFGTSVAGVAGSAMLGLLSTLSRRERLQSSQLLDTKIGGALRNFSGSHQQKLAFQAIQDQAQALPAVAEQLSNLANNLEKMGERIGENLLFNQEQFQGGISKLYQGLNESVDLSLKSSLVESAQLINSSIQPMAEKTLSQLNNTVEVTQQKLADMSGQQLATLTEAMHSNNSLMREAQTANSAQQKESTQAMLASLNNAIETSRDELQKNSQQLLSSFTNTSEQWAVQQREQATEFKLAISQELGNLRADEDQRGIIAVDRLSQLEGAVTTHLATLGKALEEPMMSLIETASQTPKAAAEVIEKLRGEMTKNFERDNALLSERTRLMEKLETLSTTLETSSIGQREAIDTLIERSTETLSRVGLQFAEQTEGESSKMAGMVDQFASSSAEMASLSDAFNAAVMLFSESNSQLIENLTRIENSLEQSNSRSDEQLNYYVAQAREIIDYNLLSHKQIIESLNAQPSVKAVS